MRLSEALDALNVPADVTTINYTATNVYMKAAGLASYVMGPWHGAGGTADGYFEFRPIDRSTADGLAGVLTEPYVKIPRKPADVPMLGYDVWPAVAKPTPLGTIGIWVNGTSVYGAMDGYSYNGATGSNELSAPAGPGKGMWNEDAYWAESGTFDSAQFHQDGPGPTYGKYHSHINPLGLRWQLEDHVTADTDDTGAVTGYNQFPAFGNHSPILGWAFDGYPIYGPYGYSDRLNSSGGVSRMRSGYTLRDGSLGTRNLKNTGRDQLPDWAVALGHAKVEVGPPPGTWVKVLGLKVFIPSFSFPLGCFVEDWDYRGDLAGGGSLYTDWDLDRYNGRWCVTPEYPNGTYAYFVALDESFNPQFPYIIGPQYMGNPTGGEVGSMESPYANYR